MDSLRVAALEPYAAVSHVRFLEELARHSRHQIEPLSLPARGWKWRMRTASFHYADVLARLPRYDLWLCSDYLSLAELYGLLAPEHAAPALVCFHENQLTYPLQPGEARDHHFALSHLHAGLAARAVVFHSGYHRRSFLAALAELLRRVPDVDMRTPLARFEARSAVVPLGTELARRERAAPDGPPLLSWSHRWEYDKDPETFAEALGHLAAGGVDFRVALFGQRFRAVPAALARLRASLGERVVVSGFVERAEHERWLRRADLVVSSARHEFFGLGTLEALRSGALPVLPDELAYPELLPPALRRPPWLWPSAARPAASPAERGAVLARALEGALALCRGPEGERARGLLDGWTERFHWSSLAPVWDRILDEAASGAPGTAFSPLDAWKQDDMAPISG